MSNYFSGEEQSESSKIKEKPLSEKTIFQKINIYCNLIKDTIIIYDIERWLIAASIVMIYIARVLLTKGYYFLTYCISIYILNEFIGFISPLEDPEELELNDDDSFLPQKNNEEFKPFRRKVKEYTFWSKVFFTFLFSIPLTFIKSFDIPVFWPLLLIYFFLIFFLVMKKRMLNII